MESDDAADAVRPPREHRGLRAGRQAGSHPLGQPALRWPVRDAG